MIVRITREPTGAVDGVSLRHYRKGCAYDVPAELAEYLAALDFAVIEMRGRQRSSRVRTNDRRRHGPGELLIHAR
jgi:hypothetical protein